MEVFVGWTTSTLKKRYEQHVSEYKKRIREAQAVKPRARWAGRGANPGIDLRELAFKLVKDGQNVYPSVQVLAQGDCYIEQLEAYPCKSSEAAIARKFYWIDRTPDTVNDLEGTYEGESLEGQPHGRGTFVYAHGATYEGEWVQGKRHGAGRLVQADGGSYVGEWREDMKHGKGKDVFASGWDVASQECQYKKGKIHGPIAVTYADGKAYIGRCDEDENVGLGVKWSADRTQAWEMEGGAHHWTHHT